MKRFKTIIFTLLILFTIILIISIPVRSYPGQGDCRTKHPIVKIKIPLYENATLILDGNASESFWTNPNITAGRKQIPLANELHKVFYLNASFIMNKTHIFVLCQWLDNTTMPEGGGEIRDALLICWNINWPSFSAYFPSGMKTNTPGTYFDNWQWNCDENEVLTIDTCYGFTGEAGFEIQDLKSSWTNVSDHSYTVELCRKLETGDTNDFQIKEKTLYLFNMGILNDDRHQNHYISYTYALDLSDPIIYEGDDSDEDSDKKELNFIFIIILSSIITVGIVSLIMFYYKKRTV